MTPSLSMLRRAVIAGATLATIGLVACEGPMEVDNENNPDVNRVYATPSGVETLVSKLYQQIFNGMYNVSNSIWPGVSVMSFESASQLGNFGMGTRAAIPRTAVDNSRGNREEVENLRVFDFLQRNARTAVGALAAADTFRAQGRSTGSAMRDARTRSFAHFTMGYALGNLALFYDSASVPLRDSALIQFPPYVAPLVGRDSVMNAALRALDSAEAIATATSDIVIEAAWVASPSGNWTNDQYRRVIRSLRARFRANHARTLQERQAVDWAKVIADATTGITADLMARLHRQDGWEVAWHQTASTSAGWHQMPLMIFGMADTSRAYDTWLATPLNDRTPFLVRTPDRRWPSGDDRATQQSRTGTATFPAAGSTLYIRNRPTGEDTPAQPWGTSDYDYFRFWQYRALTFNNYPWPIITKAEIDMLAAEGHIRTNNLPAAATLIDVYRTRNNLPATAGSPATMSLANPVPGGNACVPRVPVGPAFTSTACGNLYEAMKYEKRMETAFTGFGQWFLDGRGWDDLPEGTPLEYPVPYQEMDARARPFYNSQLHKQGKGTYGL